MSSYIQSVPDIPSLEPTQFYKDDTQPLQEQLEIVYQRISDIVNDKKRRDQYLQQEIVTNDLWQDGKSIYCKTIHLGVLTQGATNTIAHGISTIDWLVDAVVSAKDATPNRRMIGYASATGANEASLDVGDTNIVIVTGATFGVGFDAWATLYYTKI